MVQHTQTQVVLMHIFQLLHSVLIYYLCFYELQYIFCEINNECKYIVKSIIINNANNRKYGLINIAMKQNHKVKTKNTASNYHCLQITLAFVKQNDRKKAAVNGQSQCCFKKVQMVASTMMKSVKFFSFL